MKNALITFVVLGIFTACLFSFNVFAQESGLSASDSAIILFVEGDVKVKSAQSEVWMSAEKGMVLSKGDNLKNGPESWAEIGFGKDFKNSVRVQEKSHVVFTDIGTIKIDLIQGELRSLVENLSKNTIFEIKTPVSICGVRGTGWDTITDGKTAETDVYENNVFFSGMGEGSQGAVIDAGKMGLLWDPEKPIVIGDLPIDKMNDWNKWKEDFIERKDALTGLSPQDRASSAEDMQALTEGGMDKIKPAVSGVNDERDIDRRLEPVTIPSNGY